MVETDTVGVDYVVRVGGENVSNPKTEKDENGDDKVVTYSYYEATITVTATAAGEDKIDIIWGDVDFSGDANIDDALYILAAKAGGTKIVGDNNTNKLGINAPISGNIIWGDVDFSGDANIDDALYILAAKAGGTKVVGDNNTAGYGINSPYKIDAK